MSGMEALRTLVRRVRWEHPQAQHIGTAHGRIAIWCDEGQALEIADRYSYPDKFGQEVREAVERAYPKDDDSG